MPQHTLNNQGFALDMSSLYRLGLFVLLVAQLLVGANLMSMPANVDGPILDSRPCFCAGNSQQGVLLGGSAERIDWTCETQPSKRPTSGVERVRLSDADSGWVGDKSSDRRLNVGVMWQPTGDFRATPAPDLRHVVPSAES